MTTDIATAAPHRSLVAKMAGRFGVDPDKLLATLKGTCFKTKDPATNEQMVALLVVADQYRLNPFTKEIFAFEDKHKGIVPVVSVDGWARIINEHPQYDGIEFRWSETMATMPSGKPCPEWCEAVIYRKDRTRPTIVREYLDEVYQAPRNGFSGPWQSHTKRFLRHKTLIQGARVAFGFAGIYDEDEAGRIIDGTARVVDDTPDANAGKLADGLRQRQSTPIDADFTQPDPEPQDEATGELSPLQLIAARMRDATTLDELNDVCEGVSALEEKADRVAAMDAYNTEVARLEAAAANPL